MYDAVIVGARPAGAATAMLLAREGLDVLVVDRSQYGRDTLSTHALMRGGVLQLTRWGLLDAIVAAGTPAIRRTLFHHEDGTSAVSIKPAAGVDALYAPRRTVLDRVLVDAARACGAEVVYGMAATALLRDDGGRVRGVVARDRSGQEHRLPASLTIGADGLGSFVASEAGAAIERRGHSTAVAVYGYWRDLETEGYEWFYRQGLMAGFIPTNGGEVCVCAGGPPGSVAERDYFAALESAAPGGRARLAAASPPTGVRRFPGAPGHLRRASGPGWALVGDAGYFKDPLSTHGITDALRDAELLARAVVADDLAAYQRERDRLSLRLFDVVDELASYRWDTAQVRRILRELSSAMSDEIEALLTLGERPLSTLRA